MFCQNINTIWYLSTHTPYISENEGHSFHLPYEDKVKLIALTQQAKNGPIQDMQLPPLGAFDVIGKERRYGIVVISYKEDLH